MRNIILLFAFLFISILTIAQPTLSDSWIPEPGDSWESMFIEDSIAAGPSGANITWDFSAFEPANFDWSVQLSWIEPDMGSYSDSFPNASVASRSDYFGFINEAYYKETDSSFNLVGSANGIFTSIYNDPQELNYINLQYGETQQDDYTLTTYGFGLPRQASGTGIWSYDAYGTVILPNNATVNDVIRIYQQDYQVDSSSSAFSTVTINNFTGYAWIAPGTVLPIAQTQRNQTTTRIYQFGILTSEEVGEPQHTFSFSPGILSTSMEDIKPVAIMNVFPTVTKSLVTIQIKNVVYQVPFTLHNLTGQLVRNGYLTKGSNELDLTGLQSGMYLLSVKGFAPKRICKIK